MSTDYSPTNSEYDSERIIQLAESCKDADEFINAIDSLYHDDFALFEFAASDLYSHSFFNFAITLWERLLRHNIDDDDILEQGSCYSNLGLAYANLANFSKAIENYESGLKLAKEIGNRAGESACYIGLGYSYASLANFSKAIENYESGLLIAKEIGDRRQESYCYTLSAFVYQMIYNLPKAIENYESGLLIAKEIGDRVGESRAYLGLGNSYTSSANFPKAIEYHESGLKLAKEIGNRAGESACYISLGFVYDRLANTPKAIENYESGLLIAKEIGDRVGESRAYLGLGNSYATLDDLPKAIESLGIALRIVKEIGALSIESLINSMLGLLYYQNNPDISRNYFSRSIELIEMIGGRVVEEEHKMGFFGNTYEPYQYMVPLCVRLGNEEEAFEYTERSKSKAFLELLAASTLRPSVKMTEELNSLLQEEKSHLVKLREIQIQSSKDKGNGIEIGQVDRIQKALDEMYDKLEKIDPEYVSIRRPKVLSKDNTIDKIIQQILVNIKKDKGKDAIIVEYFVSTDKIYIFIVTAVSIEIEQVDCKESELLDSINRYLVEISAHDDIDYLKELSQQLASYLIKPISTYISKADLIYFVPYGILHYLPLHVLEFNNQPLIVDHAIAYLPSSSLLKFLKNKGKSTNFIKSCSSFGVVFKEEAQVIAELFNTVPYPDVTKDQVINIINNKTHTDVLHFSCHGRFNNYDPLSSGLLLYNDNKLTARDILNLNLNSELVTLSACETGINENKPGDELIGLTRSFIYAGTPSVLVSLWTVDATSTLDLMVDFYKQLRNGNNKSTDNNSTNDTEKRIDRVDIATALQKAQKNIMQRKDIDYSHPYYWAPFVLVGDWE